MHYEVFVSNAKLDAGNFESFGIEAIKNGGGVVKQIPDVSLDFTAVNKVVNMMNECKLEFVHLEAVIEDFFA